MKRWKKVLLALGALIIVVVVAIPIFVNANTFRPVIEKQLTTVLGRKVTLGDLRLSVLSGSLVAKDLSIAGAPTFSTSPFLTAKELRIGVRLRPLIFSHELVLRGFQIESPQINLVRAANGTWNFSTIGRKVAPGDSSTGAGANAVAENSHGAAAGLSDISVSNIVINDGRVAISSLRAQGVPVVCDHVNITLRDFSFAATPACFLEMAAVLVSSKRKIVRVTGTKSATSHLEPTARKLT